MLAKIPLEQFPGSVLVIDDDEDILSLVEMILRRNGYEVTTAQNGEEGLAQAAATHPDLILSDVMMPELDGLGMLKRLRSNPSTRGTPVIFMTTKTTSEDIVRGLNLGADDYLCKPFKFDELLARVKAKIERPTVPVDSLPHDRQTGLLAEPLFYQALEQEMVRAGRSGRPGCLAYLELVLPGELTQDRVVQAEIARQVSELLLAETEVRPLDIIGRDHRGRFLLLLPETHLKPARVLLQSFASLIAQQEFSTRASAELKPVRAVIGFSSFFAASQPRELQKQAQLALEAALPQPEADPVVYWSGIGRPESANRPGWWAKARHQPEAPAQSSEAASVSAQTKYSILVVDDDPDILHLLGLVLRTNGYEVTQAYNGREGLNRVAEIRPDLVLSDVMMPDMDGLTFLKELRSNPATRALPVIMLTAKGTSQDVIGGFALGADDYLSKPFEMRELLARVKAKIERPPVPAEYLPLNPRQQLLTPVLFKQAVQQEVERAGRSGLAGCVAYMGLEELSSLDEKLGLQSKAELLKQVGRLLQKAGRPLDLVGFDARKSQFSLLLPEITLAEARQQLQYLTDLIVKEHFSAGHNSERVRLTPTVGYASYANSTPLEDLFERASTAQHHAAAHLDLQPMLYSSVMESARPKTAPPVTTRWQKVQAWWNGFKGRLLLPSQIVLTYLLSFGMPLVFYLTMARLGLDVSLLVYWVVVVALLITAYLIWVEGLLSLEIVNPPATKEYPPASAIIAAYLPNEAATIIETVKAFLKIQYPGRLQIILAYNTPRPFPVEVELKALAQRYPNFVPFRVETSTSKAQNVNAALAIVEGEFVGVFDADHHPDPGSFKRAWHWLANGYDVVQGHCLVRNGDESWMARLVAVEFEAIYAVSHPGRSRLHHYGIFGGSNGYWKTDLLRHTRMHGFMLTEDIDSSLRVTEAGYKIANDPFLISRELATVTLKATWNQRMRWAQGWFQVSLKHIRFGLFSPKLSLRQKLGLFHLLAWREIYPWISGQIMPIIAFWIWKYGGADKLDWFVPMLVLTTLFTLSVGPGQVLFAWLLAAPEIQRRKSWFWFYLLMTSLFYTEFKNLIARVAQIKELMYERAWKVTPRQANTSAPAVEAAKEA